MRIASPKRGAHHNRYIQCVTVLGLAALIMLPSYALACIANPNPVTLTGGKQVLLYGDEFYSYTTDTEGRLIYADSFGTLRYVRERGDVYVSGEPYISAAWGWGRTIYAAQGDYVYAASADSEDMRQKLQALRLSASGFARLRAATPQTLPYPYSYANDPLNGLVEPINTINEPKFGSEIPLLIIKLEFNDARHQFTDEQWHDRLFSGISNYYTHVSDGKFTYVEAKESSGTPDDGVVTVRLPIDMPVYTLNGTGQNLQNGAQSGLYTGTNGKKYAIFNDSSYFAYALQALSGIVNFARYDSNKDGYVSPTELAFLIVSVGYDASTFGADAVKGKVAVWPHSWVINNVVKGVPESDMIAMSVNVDGVKMYKYTIIAENQNLSFDYKTPSPQKPALQSQFGTACHELGHDLGLRDLYPTLGRPISKEVYGLSLMAQGNWGAQAGRELCSSPTLLDPLSRQMLGFQTARVVTAPGDYPVVESANASDYNILRVDTENPDVCYFIENRQIKGMDAGLDLFYRYSNKARGGLVVWRYDKSIMNKYQANNESNAHEGEFALMPMFINESAYYDYFPFRSAINLADEESLELLRNPKTLMVNYDANAATMYAHLRLSSTPTPTLIPTPTPIPTPTLIPTPTPTVHPAPPTTGDPAQPIMWIAMCTAASALAYACVKTGASRRARGRK